MLEGTVLAGRYRLDERLGSGGYGEVWRAEDVELKRRVALKRALSGADAAGARRLKREAAIVAQVSHPGVVTVHDVVLADGDWWIVMEYVAGNDLNKAGTLDPGRAVRIGERLAAALAAVHERGIMHRDVQPRNVLLTGDDHAKLADFGISRDLYDEATLSGSGHITGTPGYLAPEVAGGEPFTKAADVFSLGATLFKAVEGASPYGTGTPMALIRKALDGDIAEPARAGELGPVLSAMLRPDPGERPSAEEAHRRLAELAGVPVPRARPRHRAWLGAAAAVVAVLLLALGTWVLAGPSSRDGAGADAGGPAAPTPSVPAGSLIGDPATAEPCALLDRADFAAYGHARLDIDRSEFQRCDVMVFQGDSATEVDVAVQLDHFTGDPPDGTIETVGGFAVLTPEDVEPYCERIVLLPRDDFVYIRAEQYGEGGDADLCAMADTAVDGATEVLADGVLARRAAPFAPESLAGRDACGLLDAGALARFPGAGRAVSGFAGWQCWWDSATTGEILTVYFDRWSPEDGEDHEQTTVAGRTASVEPEGWGGGTCVVHVEYRGYVDVQGDDVMEVVRVVVHGDGPVGDLCDRAVDMAESAAAALPG